MGSPARLIVSSALAAGLLAGCGGGRTAPPVVHGTFVGSAAVPQQALVGLIADPGTRNAAPRTIRAYLCSPAARRYEWFKGTAAGDRIELTNRTGAILRVRLMRSSATGTVTLRDGRVLRFSTRRPRPFEGLYYGLVDPDGDISADAPTGSHLQARVARGRPTLSATLVLGTEIRRLAGSADFAPRGGKLLPTAAVVAGGRLLGGVRREEPNGPFVSYQGATR